MRPHKRAAAFSSIIIAAVAITIYPSCPAYADKVRETQWHVGYLQLAQAHRITKGAGVTVAVADTGVYPHKDLAKNLKKGIDTVPGGNGTGQLDENGHGTQMAGLIAGHGRNTDDGIIGIAPSANLVPIKSAGAIDRGPGLEPGIKWAAESGADVINVSAATIASRAMNEAIAAAIRADAVVVAGSGNKSKNLTFGFPAAIPEVLAVGAIDRNGKVADFSVTGSKVGICAPGEDIVSADRNDQYYKGSGTSNSTAIVSGAAALVRAKFPELSAPEVIHRLTATATDNGPPGRDDECGYGVLNIVKALTADVPPLNAPGGTGSAAPTVSSSPAGSSAPAGTGSSVDAAPPSEPSSSNLPAIAGIGGAVLAVGAILALLIRRQRRSSPQAPPS
ncbi:S8 family serine peptidase [Actinoplanes sp. NEAU-A12]|uniref:S8 family serine peptidase n=1 Tax=Actinoplanes sandaracinus TaxID=3045177 RepID=A0ABT6WJ30_9ACTN|nr:S8 family serine peptidase [Actinoplanes sandaracinus]MDI6099741.1 S8 family serine peptidase [Actinoplanes sandaracinus]